MADLETFLQSPAKAFLQRRLGIALGGDEDGAADAMSVDLRGLEEWQIGDRLLNAALREADFDATIAAEVARGALPPGPLGRAALERILHGVNALVRGSHGLRSGVALRVDVDVELTDVRVQGVVPAVYGDRVARIEYSKLGPRHRLVNWLHLLALTVHDPGTPWQALVAGRGDKADIAYAFVGKLEAEQARVELERLVALYLENLCSPLPIAQLSSACYAERRHRGMGVELAELAAKELWDKRFGGDRAQNENHQVWGDVDFEVFAAERDAGEEGSRFGSLSRRLWQPLLELEGMGSE